MGPMVDTFLDDLDELTRGLPTLPDQFREWTDRLMRTKRTASGPCWPTRASWPAGDWYRGRCQRRGDRPYPGALCL